MKKTIRYFLLVSCWAIGFRPALFAQQIVSEHSEVTFQVNHVTGNVEGKLTGMQGTVNFDPQNLAGSRMEATVEAKTIDTKNKARDSDLRKNKFFDTNDHPLIRFSSLEITPNGDAYLVRGDLTIKNTTRQVVIPFRREVTGTEEVYQGNFTLDRRDFNLGKSVFPPIGKKVKVNIRATVQK